MMSIHCAIDTGYTVYCTFYTAQCAEYTVFSKHSLQCTVYSANIFLIVQSVAGLGFIVLEKLFKFNEIFSTYVKDK